MLALHLLTKPLATVEFPSPKARFAANLLNSAIPTIVAYSWSNFLAAILSDACKTIIEYVYLLIVLYNNNT